MVLDVESPVRAMGGLAPAERDSDLPPKYEELEDDLPPQYSSVVDERREGEDSKLSDA